MALIKGEEIYPGLEDEVALEQAKGTISNVVDAIVELMTNSDDSYSSIEQEHGSASGRIDIFVNKLKGGRLKELKIADSATGMSPSKLEKVICYGKKTSETFSGKSVRGFFGRGLKESIIALGTGEITTVAASKRTHGKYYYDYEKAKLVWRTYDAGTDTKSSSGTQIVISSRENDELSCPEFDTLLSKIQDHFALRDILINKNRKVFLTLKKTGGKNEKTEGPQQIKYEPNTGQQIENQKLYLSGFGVADFKLYEAPERLYFARNDPSSRAGILIKTSNATLENQLFGFDNDPDAHYFFGEIRCPGILEKLRAGEKGLIKSDRKGLYWNHKYGLELEDSIKKILWHHIERKKQQNASQQQRGAIPTERANKIERLLRKLNSLAKDLLDATTGVAPLADPDEQKISHLTIFPTEAIAPPMQDREFSVYAPLGATEKNERVQIRLDDPKGKFNISSDSIALRKHNKRNDLFIGYFKIKGFREQDRTGIVAKLGREEDYAEFAVAIGKWKKKKGKEPPQKRRGGFFKDIEFDTFDATPPQRVYFDRKTGVVKIYINYPGISPYLGANGDGTESERGSLLLSELIAEAFCRETARRKVEEGFSDPEARLDQYMKYYNDHLRGCIPIIHGIFMS